MRAAGVLRCLSGILLAGVLLSACVSFPDAPQRTQKPVIEDDVLIAADGARLGLSQWRGSDQPKAVIIALHGMNDYGRSFALAGQWWAREAGVTTYAYDQRGFGRSPGAGIWPGAPALRADLRAAIEAVRARHPEIPLYVVGHSMGAAVIMSALREAPLAADGVILAAPAVWGGSQLPVHYRMSANLAAAIAPGKTLTGARAARQATDNIPVLRQMQADPNVIKQTRIDAVLGVTRIMGEAYDASNEAGGRILFLYGEKDEIIPVKSMRRAARRLCGAVTLRAYDEGWHLLFRDMQAENVWRDVAQWIDQTPRAVGNETAGPEMIPGPADVSCADGESRTYDVATPAALGN